MKIAVAVDDGAMPARHFGQAPGYIVFTAENGRIVAREERAKPVCDHGAGGGQHDETHEQDGPDLHTRMSNVIADCQVVIAGGIPGPMWRHLAAAGLQPIVADAPSAEAAVTAYLAARS